MREHHFTSFRSGLLTALGLLQACGGQAEHQGPAPDEAASALTPNADAPSHRAQQNNCAPMAAGDPGTGSCWETPRYAWDGARCASLYCCTGNECDDVFRSAMSCYGERGGCDPLAAERAECIAQYPHDPSEAGALAADACQSEGGTNCDSASFISQGAAACIAQAEGLEDGLAPWTIGLNYDSRHERVSWAVSNTTQDEPGGTSSGGALTIDATTGFVLETLEWAAIPGRPFVVDDRARTADAITRSDYSTAANTWLDGIPIEDRAALAAEWTRVGLLEHASVAAFARFALQLLGLGAPPELLGACQQAMQDELRHTRLAFGLASAYAGTPLGPGRLNLEHALDAPNDDLLAHVAMSTLVEGCIGETLAALDAREGATCATDPYVRKVLLEIARDEERHAQLAWRFLDWALGERPALARPLLDRARLARTPAPLAAPPAASLATGGERDASCRATLLQHGILPRDQRRELEDQAFELVLAPCLLALVDKHTPKASGVSEQAQAANSVRRVAQL